MKRYIFYLVLAVLISCSDNSESNAKQIDIVTGIKLIDIAGVPVGILGNPNVLTKISSSKVDTTEEVLSFFTVYPNPSSQRVDIDSPLAIQKVWIVKGVPTRKFSSVDFPSLLTNDFYSVSELNQVAGEVYEVETSSIAVNLDGFSDGYYRVFAQLENGKIYWENIYKGDVQDINEINYWK